LSRSGDGASRDHGEPLHPARYPHLHLSAPGLQRHLESGRIMAMRFGGHVSISGGLERAVERATAITADCVQIFVAAPQQWREAKHSDESVEKLAAASALFNVGPVLLHAQYLINLASPEEFLRNRSSDALVS